MLIHLENFQYNSSNVYQLFEAKLAVIVENSITNAEQILINEGKNDLAETIRSILDDVLKPQLIKLIETITETTVVDILSDATINTRRTGIIAIFQSTPQVLNPNTIPKLRK